jgi:predicted RND superfamily exporter protein
MWIKLTANVQDDSVENIVKYQEKWDRFVSMRNSQASETANRAYHTSTTWVHADIVIAVKRGLIETVLLTLVCAFLLVALFTQSLLIAVYVLAVVVWIISSLIFFMVVVFGWSVGPIEVVCLIVFIGYAITYALHIAHNFAEIRPDDLVSQAVQSKHMLDAPAVYSDDDWDVCGEPFEAACSPDVCEGADSIEAACGSGAAASAGTLPSTADLRKARLQMAFLRIGGATWGSAVSTVGSCVVLVTCTLTVFVRLASILILVTALSCFAALVVLPAALVVFRSECCSSCSFASSRGVFRRLVARASQQNPYATE